MKSSYLIIPTIVFSLSLFTFNSVSALSSLESKGVQIIKSPNVDTEPPAWRRRLEGTDLRDWINILPTEEARQANEYLIVPGIGIISPMIYTPTSDPRYNLIAQGRDLDIDEFLQQGVHHFPGTSLPGHSGNALIGGHSNFLKNQKTDFTAIFGTLPMLDPGDEIWYYKRVDAESWMKYSYVVTQSYETEADDIAVFDPVGTGSELTLYTCVPIGTADRRRIIRTNLESSQKIYYPTMTEVYDNVSGYSNLDEQTQEAFRALIASGATKEEVQQLLVGVENSVTSGGIESINLFEEQPEVSASSQSRWQKLRQWIVGLFG